MSIFLLYEGRVSTVPGRNFKKNPNKQYLGYGYYHNLRYSFHYRDQIYAGITAEKDAGEPFFTGQNKKVMILFTILVNS